jgi:hypothetical protein
VFGSSVESLPSAADGGGGGGRGSVSAAASELVAAAATVSVGGGLYSTGSYSVAINDSGKYGPPLSMYFPHTMSSSPRNPG